jgi:hypothetical protein
MSRARNHLARRSASSPNGWTLPLLCCLALAAPQSRAQKPAVEQNRDVTQDPDEPSTASKTICFPKCRKGFTCLEGQCVSLCNPPCPPDRRCTNGDCAPKHEVAKDEQAGLLKGAYLALLGGYRAGLSAAAAGTADLRAEIGGRHFSLQLGPSFGTNSTTVRGAVVGHVPIRVSPTLPLHIVPMLQLGYAFNWINDENETRQQDFFLTPGMRLRYDITRRIAILADLIQVEVAYVRLQSDRTADYDREKRVPVYWGTHLGIAVLY